MRQHTLWIAALISTGCGTVDLGHKQTGSSGSAGSVAASSSSGGVSGTSGATGEATASASGATSGATSSSSGSTSGSNGCVAGSPPPANEAWDCECNDGVSLEVGCNTGSSFSTCNEACCDQGGWTGNFSGLICSTVDAGSACANEGGTCVASSEQCSNLGGVSSQQTLCPEASFTTVCCFVDAGSCSGGTPPPADEAWGCECNNGVSFPVGCGESSFSTCNEACCDQGGWTGNFSGAACPNPDAGATFECPGITPLEDGGEINYLCASNQVCSTTSCSSGCVDAPASCQTHPTCDCVLDGGGDVFNGGFGGCQACDGDAGCQSFPVACEEIDGGIFFSCSYPC